MNYDEIYKKFIGIDKIQPLRIIPNEDGGYKLVYKENDKTRSINCEDRKILDQILVEFGGKNPETCKAPEKFLTLDGTWNSEDINELGHRITKIQLRGSRTLRNRNVPVQLPEGTGQAGIINAVKRENDNITVLFNDTESAKITRSFEVLDEFDAFAKFILNQDTTKDLQWAVERICTESRDTQQQCVWKRVKAGDGTSRMVLELVELDGRNFQECVRQDLFDAAGDMFDAPCKVVRLKKKDMPTRKICLFAAEDGSLDISGYEAAN